MNVRSVFYLLAATSCGSSAQTTPPPTAGPTDSQGLTEVPAVTGFTMVDADKNMDIKSIANGEEIELNSLFNVVAKTTGSPIAYVRFDKDNQYFNTEGTASYSMCGDKTLADGDDYMACDYTCGELWKVKATPFFLNNDNMMEAGVSLEIEFTIQCPTSLQEVTSPPTPGPTSETLTGVTSPPTAGPTSIYSLSSTPSVTEFTLVNADQNSNIKTIVDGETITPESDQFKFNVVAETMGDHIVYVKFMKDDKYFNTEGTAGYSMCGDITGQNGDDYMACDYTCGETWAVKAMPYYLMNGQIQAGDDKAVSFTIECAKGLNQATMPPTPGPTGGEVVTQTTPPPTPGPTPPPTSGPSGNPIAVTSISLIDAVTDNVVIADIENGITIPDGANINFQANTMGNVGSVEINTNGKKRTENVYPYAACGDWKENYFSCRQLCGEVTITATPYTAMFRRGTAGDSFTRTFKIACGTEPPTPGPTPEENLTETTPPPTPGSTPPPTAGPTSSFVVSSIPSVSSFMLVDAEKHYDIQSIADGEMIYTDSQNLNIVAETQGDHIVYVKFMKDGSFFNTEGTAAYSMCGDKTKEDGDEYIPCDYTCGEDWNVKAIPFYVDEYGSVLQGVANEVTFMVSCF